MSAVLYKDYFTPDEAAEYCCVSPRYFDEAVRPHVPVLRFSERKIVFRRSDLQRWIEQHGDNRVESGQARPVRLSTVVRQ
jgi:hypothetical protein